MQRMLNQTYERVAQETKGKYIVGISPDDFFNHFIPWNDETSLEYRQLKASTSRVEDLKAMASTPPEEKMQTRLLSAMNGWPLDSNIPAQTMNDTEMFSTTFRDTCNPDKFCEDFVVDICQYVINELPKDNATDYSLMQTQGSCRHDQSSDPFIDASVEEGQLVDQLGTSSGAPNDDPPLTSINFPNEQQTPKATLTRGQIASCAAIALHMSYRQHLFTFIVSGPFVRLIRWDRRGAIVTQRINYTTHPDIFFEFYLRFAQLTRAQRGFDETVQDLSPDDMYDAAMAQVAFSRYSEDMLHCEAQATPLKSPLTFSKKLLKMTVDFGAGARTFIIPTPAYHPDCLTPFSRSTRRCLVYDPSHGPETSGVLFMKDCWRRNFPRVKPEAEIYKILAEHEIKHVAKMDIGGDVPGMVTRWQEKEIADLCYPLHPHWRQAYSEAYRCHRIFLSTVARDLTAFGTVKTLLNCVADAAEAAQTAFDKARIIHRDISLGNIMIVRDKEGIDSGILIDWELCIMVESDDDHPGGYVGTLQYMSVNLLRTPENVHPQSLTDDKESFFWVLYHVALSYVKNDYDPVRLYNEILRIFHAPRGHGLRRGSFKQSVLRNLSNGYRDVHFDVSGLDDLFLELALAFYPHTDCPATDVDRAQYHQLLELGKSVESLIQYNPYYREQQSVQHLASPTWLQDTLRKHAQTIPLPSQPSQGHVVYDYHYNRALSLEYKQWHDKKGIDIFEDFVPHIRSSRMDGLMGNISKSVPSCAITVSSKRKGVHEAEEDSKEDGRASKKTKK